MTNKRLTASIQSLKALNGMMLRLLRCIAQNVEGKLDEEVEAQKSLEDGSKPKIEVKQSEAE